MLLSSSITTMYLGWTRGLREDPSNFFGHDFSKFSFNDFSFNFASIQWRNNYVSGVDKVQGARGLTEPQSNFLESEVFPCNLFYFILKNFFVRFFFQLFFFQLC